MNPLERSLELYFRPKTFERNGRVYEWLGILPFKRFVVRLGTRAGRPRDRPNNYFLWDRSPAGLQALERKTRRSETVHLLGMALPAISIAGMLLGDGGDAGTFVLMGLVFAVNFHPFLLQRHTRARIYSLLNRTRGGRGKAGQPTGPC